MAVRYTEEHAWLHHADGVVTVGMTEQGVAALGAVTFVELPEEGREVTKGEEVGLIESADAGAELLAPLDGEVVEVNAAVAARPGLLDEDAEAAWLYRMTTTTPEEMDALMDEDEYLALVE